MPIALNKLKRGFRFVADGLNHLLWPAVCQNCRESISDSDHNLCGECWGEILSCSGGNYCRRCGKDASEYGLVEGRCPDCQDKGFHFDGIIRCGVYTESLRKMILGFKKGKTELDSVLGFLVKSALDGSIFYNDIDFLVPVPLHWSRRIVRGYNQSLILAKKTKHSSAKINTDLVRIRRTQRQPAMESFNKRAANVADAFAVRRGNKFEGKNICLVDDIKTSGATLNECAKILKEAGAVKVYALALSVAGQRSG